MQTKPIVVLVIALFLAINFYSVRQPQANPAELLYWDYTVYATSMIYAEQPENFRRDPIYGNGKLSENFWLSSWAYLAGFQRLHQLTGENIERTLTYYRLIVLALYLPAMVGFLYWLTRAWLPALLLTLVSSYPSTSYIVTGRAFWGIPPADMLNSSIGYLMPDRLYMILLPVLMLVTMTYWFLPGMQQRKVIGWHVLGIGIFTGLTVYLVHATTALGMMELLGATAVILIIGWRLPWWTVIVFTVGALPFLVIRSFVGSGIESGLDSDNVAYLLPGIRSWFVYPWSGIPLWQVISHDGAIALSWQAKNVIMAGFFVVYSGVTLFSLWQIYRHQSVFAGYLLLGMQALLCLIFLAAGAIPLFILIYFIYAIRHGKVNDLDVLLGILLVIAVLLGPLQQFVLYALWYLKPVYSVISIIAEMSRYSWLGYLFLYGLSARATWEMTAHLSNQWVRGIIITILALLIWWNQQQYGAALLVLNIWRMSYAEILLPVLTLWLLLYPTFPQASTFLRNTGVIALITATGCWMGFYAYGVTSLQLVVYSALTLAVLIILPRWIKPKTHTLTWSVGIVFAFFLFNLNLNVQNQHGKTFYLFQALTMPRAELQADQPERATSHEAYLAAAAWLSQNTPKDALIHSAYFDANLRYFTRRSMLLGDIDISQGLYAGFMPLDLTAQYNQLKDPETRMQVLAEQQVDYILAPIEDVFEPETINGIRYEPVEVYSNSGARVYRLDRAN